MARVQTPQEQRVVLRTVSWGTYQRLLAEREDSAPRFTYDRGALEIMSPLLPEHEEYSDTIRFLVRILARELGISVRSFGSMTLKREDVQGGAEPDGCFYIQSEPRIRGKRRPDLGVDPPPDLVIEVDLTNPSLDKLPVYARFGVPEVWRYDGQQLEIRLLEGGRYTESAESSVLRGMSADALSGLIEDSKGMESAAWEQRVREWARTVAEQGHKSS